MKYLPKKFLILTYKNNFSNEKNFAPASKNRFSSQRKNFLYLPEKITNLPPKEKIILITRKSNFPNKKFLIFAQKS